MATSAILNFINTPKASTHYGKYFYDEDWWKKSIFLSPPFFISMATAAKFVLLIQIFLVYLVPLNVDVTGNITAKICEVWSEFNIFCILVTMGTAAILNLFNPPKLPHTTVDISTKSHEVWWKESTFLLDPPFFVSMASVATFVQPIPIFSFHWMWMLFLSNFINFCSANNLLRSFLCF